MSIAEISLALAFLIQFGAVVYRFSKAESAIKALEKDVLDVKDLKLSLNEINLNLTLLNQSVHEISGKKIEAHEAQIKALEKEVMDLKYNLK